MTIQNLIVAITALIITQHQIQEQTDQPTTTSATQIRLPGSCGSGFVCGYHKTGSLIMTNAHVTGTRIGTNVTIVYQHNNQRKQVTGRIVQAAYSTRTLTDWSLVYVDQWQELPPLKMSIQPPTNQHYIIGSPNCVWPLRRQDIITRQISDNSPLWRWQPPTIPGNSGGPVVRRDRHTAEGLVTWLWGGLGAGQTTSEIYRQQTQRTTAGIDRIDGLIEVGRTDVELTEGFHSETDLTEFDIWDKPPSTDPLPPLTDVEERTMIKRLLEHLARNPETLSRLLKAIADKL